MTTRGPLRKDLATFDDARDTLNAALRDVSIRLDEAPRRNQTWARFSSFPLAGQSIATPDYPVAAVLVLAVTGLGTAGSGLTAAPWLDVTPVEGKQGVVQIAAAYGLPASGAFDALLEFVEDVTPGRNRSNSTGGRE